MSRFHLQTYDCQSCVSIEPEIVVSLQLVNRCALGSNFSCNLCQKHHHMLCSRTALMRQCRAKGHHNMILTVPIADRAFPGSCKAPCQAARFSCSCAQYRTGSSTNVQQYDHPTESATVELTALSHMHLVAWFVASSSSVPWKAPVRQ